MATGITVDQTFGFGGAVLVTQTNGLGQKLVRTIDAQGRVTKISDPTIYNYAYDNLKQLTGISRPFTMSPMVESYTYSSAGNPTASKDSSGATWTYGSAGKLNQIASRSSDKGGSETYTYDAAGRVATWKNANGTYTYYYDGLGRLRGVTLNGVWQMVLDYDTEGALVRRGDNNPHTSSPSYTYHFADWRWNEKTGIATEHENALVSSEIDKAKTATRQWLFKEYDGHVAMTLDDAGTLKSKRTLGAYGALISSSGTPWDWNSYHGALEQDELFHMEQRHLMQSHGQWLQPEPLLYEGLNADKLADPLSVATPRYARNTPTVYRDVAGNDPLIITNMSQYSEPRPMVLLSPSQPPSAMQSEFARSLASVTAASGVFTNPKSTVSDKMDAFMTITNNINPSSGFTGVTGNCARIVEALASTLAGRPAVATAGVAGLTGNEQAAKHGAQLAYAGSAENATQMAQGMGDGARVMVYSEVGGDESHVQLGLNIEGETWFVEGQSGAVPYINNSPRGEGDSSYHDYLVAPIGY